jgi:membrane dipeptidase
MALDFVDHRADPGAWARALGIPREAVELYLASEVIDQHVDTFIWHRVFGYDLTRRHGTGPFGARLLGQVDFPRIREAALGGAVWVVTTNPLRPARSRPRVLVDNVRTLLGLFAKVPDDFAHVTSVRAYRAARAAGKHAAFVGIQGGNALDHDVDALDRLPPGAVLRVTLVHLSNSRLGATSSPLRGGGDAGLSDAGRALVEALHAKKIFVDLAHISKKGFWDALAVHDRSIAPIVTHTGIAGVHPHWRNLDDEQVRAIADRGGTIGIMYQASFLGAGEVGRRAARIVDHLDHVIRLTSDDHASLGSDWDGAIVTPRDMPTCLELPRLVAEMLARGYTPERVQKILGGNFLRTVASLRG